MKYEKKKYVKYAAKMLMRRESVLFGLRLHAE